MMKRMSILAGVLAVLWGACPAMAELKRDYEVTGGGDVTVVTANRLVFDYSKQYALFEGNVVVSDPDMKLSAETLIIKFSDDDEVSSIVAKTDVVIIQQDKRAEAGVAAYDVLTGKIVLEQNPRVRRGKDLLMGDTITFWRDQNKMVCEPRARLIIFPDEDGARTKFLGAE